jgi:hypothetical protein
MSIINNYDMICCILNYLDDKTKINFCLTNHYIYNKYVKYIFSILTWDYKHYNRLSNDKKIYCKKIINVNYPEHLLSNNDLSYVELFFLFNKPIYKLPPITHIKFNYYFNHQIHYLPSNLLYLELGSNFNTSIDSFPPNLLYLKFGYRYDKPLHNLPKNLVYLYLGYHYNHYIENYPSTLKSIIFGDMFNQNINNLPYNLQYLTIGYHFDKITNILPNSLINISCKYKNPNLYADDRYIRYQYHVSLFNNIDNNIIKLFEY